MTIFSRTDAQKRVDDIRVFRMELSRLEREGVLHIDEPQRDALEKHHRALFTRLSLDFDVDRDEKSKQLSLGMRIASFAGALALTASVCLLFYQFRGFFSTPAQVAILASVGLGSFLLTVWIDSRDATGYFTRLAAMVGFACFVLNVVMLRQIFDVTPAADALLPWAAFAFLLAYAFDLRLLLATGILCLIGFISAHTGAWGGMYWSHFGERPENFLPAAVAIFLMPQLFDQSAFRGFAAIYRIFGSLTLFLPMLVLANWGRFSYLDLDGRGVQYIYQACGFLGTAALVWYGARRRWPDVVNTGVALFVCFFYSKLFDWWWESMPKYLFFLLMGLAAILLLLVFKRLRKAST